jgi:hypothetical protein
MASGDKYSQRVQAHQLGCHVPWRVRGTPETDVDPAVGQEGELVGHAGLYLVDLQVGKRSWTARRICGMEL